jgi:hypothetical protein
LIAADLFHLHWRVIFLINVPVVAAVLSGGIRLLPDVRGANPAPIDRMGVFLCAITLGLLIVPLVEGRELGWPAWSIAMLVATPIAGFCFWRHEAALARRGGTPLVSVELAPRPGLVSGLVGVLFFYVVSAFFLTFSVYLQSALGVDALDAGLAFLPCGIGFLVGPLVTPIATRAFGRFVPALGMLLEVAGCIGVAAAVADAPTGCLPARLPLIVAIGLIGFGQGIAALGVAVMGGVFFSVAGRSPDALSMAHALIAAMLCIAASLAVSAIVSIVASKETPAATPPILAHRPTSR